MLLELNGVSKQFDGKIIIDNQTFHFERKKHYLISGQSGCGKTTLLRIMALLEEIDSGFIKFDGKRVVEAQGRICLPKTIRPKIGIVFQQLHVWPHLTVLENVAMPLYINGMLEELAKQKSILMLTQFGLGAKANSYPATLSGGEQQRVAIARTLVHKPELLLLDEITSGLDYFHAKGVFQGIEFAAESGATIIIVSHQQSIPTALALNKLEMANGKLSLV